MPVGYCALRPCQLTCKASILGLWLTVTETGFLLARICDMAQPQPRPDPVSPFCGWLGKALNETLHEVGVAAVDFDKEVN